MTRLETWRGLASQQEQKVQAIQKQIEELAAQLQRENGARQAFDHAVQVEETMAVQEAQSLQAKIAAEVARSNELLAAAEPKPEEEQPLIFLGLPTRGGLEPSTAMAMLNASQKPVRYQCFGTSLLAHGFNALWCMALNSRPQVTTFAMLHDDIGPHGAGWLERLVEEREQCGADVLSVAMPIKDDRGLSSVALLTPETGELRRLTMKELEQLPETFGAEQFPGKVLLGNTGLWCCDFTKPWVEQIVFTIRDRIIKRDGAFVASCWSEDWNFSRDCQRLGLKVMVTRKIKADHFGKVGYPNYTGWGKWDSDKFSKSTAGAIEGEHYQPAVMVEGA